VLPTSLPLSLVCNDPKRIVNVDLSGDKLVGGILAFLIDIKAVALL
jgi:hypothetical protein